MGVNFSHYTMKSLILAVLSTATATPFFGKREADANAGIGYGGYGFGGLGHGFGGYGHGYGQGYGHKYGYGHSYGYGKRSTDQAIAEDRIADPEATAEAKPEADAGLGFGLGGLGGYGY